MFSASVIAERVARLERHYKLQTKPYSVDEIDAWKNRLAPAFGENPRQLVREEKQFILNELILTRASFLYWVERYGWANIGGSELRRLWPLWESQEIMLRHIAEIEERVFESSHDGILINVLKARQLGMSTLIEAIGAHRATTNPHIFGLVAADVPEQSNYMFEMLERFVEHLPPWLNPGKRFHLRGEELVFETDTHIWVGSGKSTRGQGAEHGQERGQLSRGKTLSFAHLSELSSWDAAEQIDSALIPAINPSRRTFVAFESTAKGFNWWWQHWKTSEDGLTRFTNIFIPWYVERTKYQKPAPSNWSPSQRTLTHARMCADSSTPWMGSKVELSRDQLYWYETTRAGYEAKGLLSTFLEEYAYDADDAFQQSGRGIFDLDLRQRVKEQAKPIQTIIEVHWGGGISDARPEILPHSKWPVIRENLPDDPALFGVGYVLIWEPRRAGHRYVLSGDVSDGLGLDRAVVDITRVGTLELPDEQVAQFVSSRIDPIELATIIDFMGRMYKDDDGLEALAAIENNGHGLATQAQLQLHLGYSYFFTWKYVDMKDVSRRESTRIGWYTSARTRPMILTRYVKALKTVDVVTGQPDYILNSPFTQFELPHFQTAGELWQAEATLGRHDDCIMTGAIGVHVAADLHFEDREPLADQRRRLALEATDKARALEISGKRLDYCNQDYTVEEMEGRIPLGGLG